MHLGAHSMRPLIIICSHTKTLEKVVQLTLHESYCLPLLTYAAGAVSYNQRQVHDLNVCWNTVYRIGFNFNRRESVKSFISGLGKLSVQYVLKMRAIKFHYPKILSATCC